MHERAARLPQVDVGLVAQQVERPVCAAVVDDQEGRYAESPAFREEPGKPWGLVADDETAEHFARIDVYRPIVHAAKAMSRERSVMTVQFRQGCNQNLVEQRLFRKAAKPMPRTRRLRPPSAARCRELSRAGRVLPPHRRRVRRRGGSAAAPGPRSPSGASPDRGRTRPLPGGHPSPRPGYPAPTVPTARSRSRGHRRRLGHGRLVEALI